jgi:hypothetical protein
VSSLRNLLDHPATEAPVQHYVPVTPAAAITDTVEEGDALVWYQGRSASCRPR